MCILAMDTSGDYAVLVLADLKGSVLASRSFRSRRMLSQRLLGEIDSLLKSEGCGQSDLTAIAVGLGPGSFTGVRVGVTTAKTLCQVLEKPFLGIKTLEAFVECAPKSPEITVIPLLQSRRDEYYTAAYTAGQCISQPFAISSSKLEEYVHALKQKNRVLVCGPCAAAAQHIADIIIIQPSVPSEGLALISSRNYAAGDFSDFLSLVPEYIVPPTITVPKVNRL